MGIKMTKSLEDSKKEFRAAYSSAMQEGSEQKMIACLESYSENVCAAMLQEARSLTEEQRGNTAVLAARGVRQLTSEETAYYKALTAAMRTDVSGVKNALTDISVTMPETIIDQVMQDVKSNFELLDAIDFVNSSYMTSWIYNKQGVQTAKWGAIGSAVTKELSGAFGKISVTTCKLTAFMAVSQDYLDLGAAWLDRYVRAILTEAAGTAMEAAIVDGAGNADSADCPVGMTRDLDKGNTDGSTGLTTYPQKTATKVTSLDPATYGAILAKLSKTPTGRNRKVSGVILVCNPEDYFTKIMPATTYMTPSGGYVSNVLPFPTRVIQSEGCPKGKAVVGLGKQYIGMLGAGSKRGVVTYDDSVQFLEDNRVYKIRLLGNGRPKDNTSFEVLDISALEALAYKIVQESTGEAVGG
uniref:Major capsid protein n=1 Tax=Siphoviridae sp. ctKNZ79 TaxID=2825440 RepID=A0A8S5U9G2_9CAUD|nr:MAG TPA: major capsid protein [Siphoviridae sp. ctKNZ79]